MRSSRRRVSSTQRDGVDQPRDVTALRIRAQQVEPIRVQHLVLAARRDRDQVPEPGPDQLEAEVERRGVRAAARAACLRLVLARDPGAAALGLVLEPLGQLLLDRRLRGRAALRRALQQRAPGAASTHSASSCSVRVARAAASASRRSGRLRPGERAGAVGVAARQPRAGERGGAPERPRASSASAIRAGGIAPKRTGRQREGIVSQQAPRRRADQHEVREGRGLLERLQQRVLRLVVHAVRVHDHEHPPPRLERAQRRLAHDLGAHVVDQDVVRAARLDPGEVGMHARHARAARRPAGSSAPAEISAAANARAAARLPLPGGPVEEVCVRERLLVAQRRLERDARARLVLERLDHARTWQPRQDVRVNLRRRPRCVDAHVAVGVALGELVVGRRHRALQLLALALEAIQLAAAAGRGRRARRPAGT